MAESEYQQKKPHTAALWLAVLILLILLLLSLLWLAPLLWNVSNPGSNIIPLFYTGDRQFETAGALQYVNAEENPTLTANDEDVQWETYTDVNLFRASYTGLDGSITVQSEDGEKVIGPGTAGDYRFMLSNTGNISLDYTMELNSLFTLEHHDLPIRVRLRSRDRWIVGGSRDWVNPEELTEIIEKGTLDVGCSTEYVFEWSWPFEVGTGYHLRNNDLSDTLLGSTAVEQDVHFRLEIRVLSQVTPGAVPTDTEGKHLLVPLILWNILRLAVLPGLLLGWILLLLLAWRTPIYVTGFLPGVPGAEFSFGRKKDNLRPDGQFVFKKIYTGTHTLTQGAAERKIKLRRRRKAVGILFEEKSDVLILTVHPNTRAVELYLLAVGNGLTLRRDKWAVIDSKHRVYTPSGVTEPVDKCNRTPGGLTVDAEGTLDIAAGAAVK